MFKNRNREMLNGGAKRTTFMCPFRVVYISNTNSFEIRVRELDTLFLFQLSHIERIGGSAAENTDSKWTLITFLEAAWVAPLK